MSAVVVFVVVFITVVVVVVVVSVAIDDVFKAKLNWVLIMKKIGKIITVARL